MGGVWKVVLRLGLIKPYYRLKSALKKPMGRDSGSNSGSRGSYRYAIASRGSYRYATVILIICQSAFSGSDSGSDSSYRYATVILIIWKFSLAVAIAVARVATAILMILDLNVFFLVSCVVQLLKLPEPSNNSSIVPNHQK
ncbi:hypothetical protein CASFOL_015397 [Castilleja foliolosa]|uniref:Uncharacterized protein n=1 Tax=Castilleja foliolosa TaxID=1961234 RepID=A0ABD3DH11_9LAMI